MDVAIGRGVAGLIAGVVVVSGWGGGSAAATTAGCRPPWQVVPSPDGGPTGNGLEGAAGISPSDVWAVGSYFTDRSLSLIEHWGGEGWAVWPHPEKGDDSWLLGVDGVASNDVWAAGYYHGGFQSYQHTFALHWNGATWSIVPTRDPGLENAFRAVDALAASDVWAVGDGYDASVSRVRALTEHWDGSVWSVVQTPDTGAVETNLLAVSGASPMDVWAVGEVKAPDLTRSTLALHWDGSSWQVVPTPNTGRDWNTLHDVLALAPDDAWAVGWAGNGPFPERPIVIHWDGSDWTPSPLPDAGSGGLEEVVAVAPDDLWAVGQGQDRTITFHWDGGRWRFVPGPPAYQVQGAAALSRKDVWVVGATLDVTGVHTLTEQLCGS